MELEAKVRRYIKAVEALHTIHSSTDVHDNGGFAGAAITAHCALTCDAVGGYFDPKTQTYVPQAPPHEAALAEHRVAKQELEEALLSS